MCWELKSAVAAVALLSLGCGGGESINLRTAHRPVHISIGEPLQAACAAPAPTPLYSAPGVLPLVPDPVIESRPTEVAKPDEVRPLPPLPVPEAPADPVDPFADTPPSLDSPKPKTTQHVEPSPQGDWVAVPNTK